MNSMRYFDTLASIVRDHHAELLEARAGRSQNGRSQNGRWRSLLGILIVVAALAPLGLILLGVW